MSRNNEPITVSQSSIFIKLRSEMLKVCLELIESRSVKMDLINKDHSKANSEFVTVTHN